MTASSDLLIDGYGRVRENVHQVVDGLGPEELAERVDPDANSIAWLVWHLTRVQDAQIADVAEREEVWTARGWHERFDLSLPTAATGYGATSEEVAAVGGVTADLLTGYHDEVHDQTVAFLRGLADDDLARVVDTSWTPHVTLGVRLVSIMDDDMQHVGQAAFVRGILDRRHRR